MAKFALQLYTVREPAKKDWRGTLKSARDIGYESTPEVLRIR